MAEEDYYKLLNVDQHAPDREIKKAYYNLARELHPDKAENPDKSRENAERLAGISKAYNTLKDPEKRAVYDNTRRGRGASSPPPSPPAKPAAAAAKPATPTAPAPASGGAKPVSNNSPSQSASGAARGMSEADMSAQRVLTAQKAFVKGMEYYKNQEFKKGLPFFDAAVQNDPESEPHYHMKLAICLVRSKGSFTRAVEAAERACEMDTYNVEFKLSLGEIYETVGITSKAQKVYEDILNWEPENEKAKARLAMMKHAHQKANPGMLAKIFPSLFGKK